MEFIGWLGGILLTICGIPLAWDAWSRGKVDNSVNWPFLHMWFWGEALVFIYVLPTGLLPLIANYGFNMLLIALIMFYKRWPRQ